LRQADAPNAVNNANVIRIAFLVREDGNMFASLNRVTAENSCTPAGLTGADWEPAHEET
jgi:hypothetical protein